MCVCGKQLSPATTSQRRNKTKKEFYNKTPSHDTRQKRIFTGSNRTGWPARTWRIGDCSSRCFRYVVGREIFSNTKQHSLNSIFVLLLANQNTNPPAVIFGDVAGFPANKKENRGSPALCVSGNFQGKQSSEVFGAPFWMETREFPCTLSLESESWSGAKSEAKLRKSTKYPGGRYRVCYDPPQ